MAHWRKLLLTKHLRHLQQKLENEEGNYKKNKFHIGLLWKIVWLHRNAENINKSRCMYPSSITMMGKEEKKKEK